jgi:hypothetical protein
MGGNIILVGIAYLETYGFGDNPSELTRLLSYRMIQALCVNTQKFDLSEMVTI